MKSQVTLKELARKLGIATSTVSRALKDNNEISIETRIRVKKLATELNYEPNALALSLRRSKTYTIGVILPELVHFFFSTVISGIEDVTFSKEYNVILCQSNESLELEISNCKALFNHRVDGIIACISKETTNYNHFIALQEKGIPLVFVDRENPVDASKIISGDFNGAYDATQYLLKSGCKRIIHLAGPQNLVLSQERMNGFLKAHQEYGIATDENQIVRCGGGETHEAFEIVRNLIEKKYLFDGIFAVNDMAAVGALKAVKSAKLRVPEDVSIIGYSDWALCTFISPPLTTVQQKGYEMGTKAAELLLKEMHSKDTFIEPSIIVLPTKLILRESTRILIQNDY